MRKNGGKQWQRENKRNPDTRLTSMRQKTLCAALSSEQDALPPIQW
ncbi:hypothetical protein BIFGAL_02789 [Bifidobacterium gallicum DSM 20093 = LMG 11596]|uniref:Uncharacterized protein n=1 Tax=Bifidobacterium gallicum DSM 20093 = LMG 11596 TaxID=561180 RepID=D1NSN0_9BIFI|nr:hypothetical protein BIFGAL_02789 [Bifidobacterium gallicum DSM 20093 = LMG 11596]